MRIPPELLDAKVCNLVGRDGDWNWEILDWLPDDIRLCTTAIYPLILGELMDKF